MGQKKIFLFTILILCVCVCSDCSTEGAQERELDSQRFQLSSLFLTSSSSCILSPKASTTRSSLHVVHRHGPCSPDNSTESPDLANDILRRDQERVDSIHFKLSKSFANQIKRSQSTKLPAKHGSSLGTGNYLVTVGLGTPTHNQTLVFDTGSSLTWIQCKPCRSCYRQKEPIFIPSSSSSYSNISCSSSTCSSLILEGRGNCLESNCGYKIKYGDGSSTQGFLAKERLTLTPSDVFDGVNFGCGEDNQGLFIGTAGLLGLGRGKFSFPSQTATTYNNIFSYCLPSSSRLTGHLTFGSAGISNTVKYTAISSTTPSSYYGINIVDISVDDVKLKIPSTVFLNARAVIDSGTVISRLPPKAYQLLRSAFQEKMSNYTRAPSKSLLDTCYDFTGVDMETVTFPKISFTFKGDTVINLGPVGTLYVHDNSRVCLAFAGNSNEFDIAIFGNVQQKTMLVVHDGPGKRVGFAPNGCN